MNSLALRRSTEKLSAPIIRELEILWDNIAYLNEQDRALLEKSFWFAYEAHIQQKRQDGAPYITHPVAVTVYLAELKLDVETLCAGLLHDTVEDVAYITQSSITETFGEQISFLVNAVTKLEKFDQQITINEDLSLAQATREEQYANLQLLMISASKNLRAVLIKLADRLHNMRTLTSLSIEKQRRIAQETLDIHAPLASLLGMRLWKSEMEDLSFAVLDNESYSSIHHKLETLKETINEEMMETICQSFKQLLVENNIPFDHVYGRFKTPYSIFRKTKSKFIKINELMDIVAFRVILKKRQDCYKTLGIFHSKYRHVPNTFDDYISAPKSNGYKSLHTVIFGPNKKRMEIQIRSRGMHKIAENGIAAHWRYKNDLSISDSGLNLIAQIREDVEKNQMKNIIMSDVDLELLSEEIIVYTPKGNLIRLAAKSTVLDFAFRIHSEHVGPHFSQAFVNDRPVSMGYVLSRGDTVFIETDKSIKPKRYWEANATTNRARHAIRTSLGMQEAEELNNFLTELAQQYSIFLTNKITHIMMRKLYSIFKVKHLDELEDKVFAGQIHAEKLLKAAHPNIDLHEQIQQIDNKAVNTSVDHRVSACPYCMPLPGESLIGTWLPDKGTLAHRDGCGMIKDNFIEQHCMVGSVEFEAKKYGKHEGYPVFLDCYIQNRPGMMGMICSIIGDRKVNILDLDFLNKGNETVTLRFYLLVQHSTQIDDIMNTIQHRGLDQILTMRVILDDIAESSAGSYRPSFVPSE